MSHIFRNVTIVALITASGGAYGATLPAPRFCTAEDQDAGRCNPPCASEPPVSGYDACMRQAINWCDRLGYGRSTTSGCAIWYTNECYGSGQIAECALDQCISDIRVNQDPGCVPGSCLSLWHSF